ncbi:MAG: glycosyltransferase family 2 protein [Acidimicrobiia bacterium]|nr:glycosyltransferase family 2 protein [Acidimicrobiia bacterium]
MRRPLVSLIVPAYNEAETIERNLGELHKYTLEHQEYAWEIIVVNDGSTDETGSIARGFAGGRPTVRVLEHRVNFKLGQALRYAFGVAKGDYVVTFDSDLSYSVDHIGLMLAKLDSTDAKVVVASPYAEGGTTTNVPFVRRVMSRAANWFLSLAAKGDLTTLTGMVRAYDGVFLRSLNLKAMDAEINPEIIYKAQLLRALILEVPAHLDWTFHHTGGTRRQGPFRISRGVLSNALLAFVFRPFMFFVLPGLILVGLTLIGLLTIGIRIGQEGSVAAAFSAYPMAFLATLLGAILGAQLVGMGVMAMQSKRYFEELFHLGTSVYREQRKLTGTTREGEIDQRLA